MVNSYGECSNCPDFSIVSSDKKSCKPLVCRGEKEIIKEEGTCTKCPEFTRPDSDGRECIADKCEEGKEL